MLYLGKNLVSSKRFSRRMVGNKKKKNTQQQNAFALRRRADKVYVMFIYARTRRHYYLVG